ncbi:hypothetical protein F7734_17455 [Scytonema sp. UIC 10036]|uniref:hypothetical protein n=1 Tax=Scytonema sp. UIC 10036 TaxID=2304196 RepID=UPI0012DA2C29|nr:hypothetical protein [Scytonema sp. UIC 10036]MUG94080.1 hypothetical protein [Scytonema sp. UIC 10036]
MIFNIKLSIITGNIILKSLRNNKNAEQFYDEGITEEQKSAAQEVRKLIKEKIGSYKDYQSLAQHRERVDPKLIERARNLGALAIQLQWVEGNATKAEASFFKIKHSKINPRSLR